MRKLTALAFSSLLILLETPFIFTLTHYLNLRRIDFNVILNIQFLAPKKTWLLT